MMANVGRSAFVLTLLLAACAKTAAPPRPVAASTFWQGAGDWTVTRQPLSPGVTCAAMRSVFWGELVFNEGPDGAMGWSLKDTIGHAAPGKSYPITLTFVPGGDLTFTAELRNQPPILRSQATDSTTAAALGRDIAAARYVEISGPVLGDFGRYDLSGAPEALMQLNRCARGG